MTIAYLGSTAFAPDGSPMTSSAFDTTGATLIVITVTLMFPARQTVRAWGKRQLLAHDPGSFLHGAGEVVVTVL